MNRTLQAHRTRLQIVESALVLTFLLGALRYLVGALYSRVASASIVAVLQASNPGVLPQLSSEPGFVLPEVVGSEISLTVYMVALPLLAVVIGRFRLLMLGALVLAGGGRVLMFADTGVTSAAAAAVAVGGGLLYLTLLARHRHGTFAPSMLLALTADQMLRAAGNTLDISWSPSFVPIQAGLFIGVLLLAALNYILGSANREHAEAERGLITVWGGAALGAMLFLQLSLLSTANAVVGRANLDYPVVVPVLIGATLLPLVPSVRRSARAFIGIFDASVRGWIWLVVVFLLLVLGTRLTGVIAGIGFVGAQFAVSMLWWWMLRPQAEGERNLSGLWVVLGAGVFTVLVLFDILTYEYAYTNVNIGIPELQTVISALLRGFRGFGYAVILLAGLLVTLPMLQTQRRIAWRSTANNLENVLVATLLAAVVTGGAFLAGPPLITQPAPPASLRVGTYNIHGGYTEFFASNLEVLAQTIDQSGAQVVLLQEAEAGRLTSFGVDQPLWLARRLGMDRRFFPTNEGLQGLAVLSDFPISFADGEILPGTGQQTGLQRVQIQPLPGEVVTLYNTWLGLLIAGENIESQEQDQQRQLDQIISIIGNHHPDRQLGRTILGGTFNNVPDSDIIRNVDERGFSDPFAGANVERSATLVRTGVSARIDYIWIYPEIAEGVGVIPSNASDHRLAFVEISLAQP